MVLSGPLRRKHVLGLFLSLAWVTVALGAVPAAIRDSFDRADSPALGKSDVGGYPWIEVRENEAGAVAIAGKQLQINYLAGRSSLASATLGGFMVADLDLTVKASCYYGDSARAYGVSYRLDSKEGVVNSPGYHVLLSGDGARLTFAGKELARKDLALPIKKFHALRVAARGNSHKIYVNGDLLLDVTDDSFLGPGFVGLTQYYEIAKFDDFALTPLSEIIAVAAAHLAELPLKNLPVEPVYPEGKRFPLALFSIQTPEEMAEAGKSGWMVGHTYNFRPVYLDVTKQAGWLAVARLAGKTKVQVPARQPVDAAKPGATVGRPQAVNTEEAGATGEQFRADDRVWTEDEAKGQIEALARHDNLAWWDLPEEMRYWRAEEYALVKDLSAWVRKYDPRQRPIFMYQPGHSDATRVAKYVPYLDIIGCGTYTEYVHQPRAWVRWRTEETIRGITLAGYKIGPDYKNGERTPIGIPMLFYGESDAFDVITPVEAYHDFWSCIASGAKGIYVFSYFHRQDLDILQRTWEQGYKRAAANLMRDGELDQAILFGKDVPLRVEITRGAPRTVSFRPYGVEEDISYPAVNVLAKFHEGVLYIIAVSSQERPVTARISGLPAGVKDVRILFESQTDNRSGNTVAVADGGFEDNFGWLAVHVYKAAL